MGGAVIKENDRMNSTMIYSKNFCKDYNVPSAQQ
jgi:hypothetical protein